MRIEKIIGITLFMLIFALIRSHEVPAQPTAKQGLDMDQVEQGRYISRIAGCNDCHTPGYLLSEGKVIEELWLTGAAFGWRGPWGTTYASNLRTYVNNMTEEQWVESAHLLKARPPMPWFNVNIMLDTDLRSLYQFIKYLGPAGEPAPAYLPPDREPKTPYALFPSPPSRSVRKPFVMSR